MLKDKDAVRCVSHKQFTRMLGEMKALFACDYIAEEDFHKWHILSWEGDSWNATSSNEGYNFMSEAEFMEKARDHFRAKLHNVPDDIIQKTKALGIVPGVTVKFTHGGEYVIPEYDKWTPNGYGGWYWHQDHGAPHGWAWIYNEMHPSDVKVVTTLTDDVIRVGDTVKRVEGEHSGMNVGDTDVVTSLDSGGRHVSLTKYTAGHSLRSLKKIKDGGPIPATKTTSSNEQVHGTSKQNRGSVEGRAVERSDAGRSCSVGSRHPGNGARVAIRERSSGKGAIRLTLQRSLGDRGRG